jgi:hypothetical protein
VPVERTSADQQNGTRCYTKPASIYSIISYLEVQEAQTYPGSECRGAIHVQRNPEGRSAVEDVKGDQVTDYCVFKRQRASVVKVLSDGPQVRTINSDVDLWSHFGSSINAITAQVVVE